MRVAALGETPDRRLPGAFLALLKRVHVVREVRALRRAKEGARRENQGAKRHGEGFHGAPGGAGGAGGAGAMNFVIMLATSNDAIAK